MTPVPPTRRFSPAAIVALAVLAAGVLVFAAAMRGAATIGRAIGGRGETEVTQSVVVEKVREVAQLVTSETTVRDVVAFRNRWLGSTKQSLVVATGRVLAGFDLDRGTEVSVDEEAKRIRIELPPAGVLAVDVTELETYDERSGLWNPFRPADRDTIYRLARDQLAASAGELGVTRHAERTAKRLLESLVNPPGYTTEVTVRGRRAGEAGE